MVLLIPSVYHSILISHIYPIYSRNLSGQRCKCTAKSHILNCILLSIVSYTTIYKPCPCSLFILIVIISVFILSNQILYCKYLKKIGIIGNLPLLSFLKMCKKINPTWGVVTGITMGMCYAWGCFNIFWSSWFSRCFFWFFIPLCVTV